MEERNIEAEYDAWVTRSVDLYEEVQTRGQDVFDNLLKIEPGDFNAFDRKYALANVIIYMLHGRNRDQALKHLGEVIK